MWVVLQCAAYCSHARAAFVGILLPIMSAPTAIRRASSILRGYKAAEVVP